MNQPFAPHLVENLSPFWHQRLGQLAPSTTPYSSPSHYPDAPTTSTHGVYYTHTPDDFATENKSI